jgi:hypothetical protein
MPPPGMPGDGFDQRPDQGDPADRPRAGIVIRQRDVAIPERPTTGPIAAIESDNIAAFARELRAMRSKAELDYPEMAERSHYTMRTLASAAGGLRLPTLPVMVAYVRACGGSDSDVQEWEERWQRLAKARGKGELPALPAAGSDNPADMPMDSGQGTPGTPGAPGTGIPGTPGAPGGTAAPGGQPSPGASRPGEVYVITSAPERDERW